MTAVPFLAQQADELAGGSAIAEWHPLVILLSVVAGIMLLLIVRGAPGDHRSAVARFVLRMPNQLAKLTGMPAWAATAWAGTLGGLVIAAYGFFTDVAYHVAYGRDETLFTAPHTAIFVGVCLIAASAAAGILVANLTGARHGTRLSGIQVPWSLIPLVVLGSGAVAGFGIDEVWHAQYGVDVTMWSAPHMLMILGAALSSTGAWFVLAEGGVRPGTSRRATALHAVTAMTVLVALFAPLGEFDFGVPQFQQLYHPVLVLIASAAALVAVRLVLGRGWTLGVLAIAWVAGNLDTALLAGSAPVETRDSAILLGSAVVVEVVALLVGTRHPVRFAVLAGLGVSTLGLATEWWWNSQAHQPWTTSLLPDVLVVGIPAAVAAAVVAAAYAGAVLGRPGLVSGRLLAVALLVVGLALAVPFPRTVGDVAVQISVEDQGDGMALVHAQLDPPDAAEDARWFYAGAWQGGGNTVAHMQPLGEGRYVAEEPIEVHGPWKAVLRLHVGSDMMAAPIRMPADPMFDLEEIPLEDRAMAFEAETRYLLRETNDGPPALAVAVRLLFVALAAAWLAAMCNGGRRLAARGEHDAGPEAPDAPPVTATLTRSG